MQDEPDKFLPALTQPGPVRVIGIAVLVLIWAAIIAIYAWRPEF